MRTAFALVLGTVLTVYAGEAASPTAGIRVRLYDYAGVSQPVLARAKAEAAAILRSAGVRVEWAECRITSGDTLKDPACALPITPIDLQVRIVNFEMAKRLAAPGHTLGYALLADGFDSIAAVFYHRAVELERSHCASRSAILGAILAHEVAHLLLERNHHSRTGILQASWGDDDLRLIAKGRSGFTKKEGLQMAAMVARRASATVYASASISE
jgi:hypothetical protein